MGNCQAVEAASLVIHHPSGKHERMYWPITVSEVMKTNPGHYVSLIIPLPAIPKQNNPDDNKTVSVRFTRVKLLMPCDILVLGRAYRLLTTQEVTKVLRARKHDQMKKMQSELGQHMRMHCKGGNNGSEKDQARRHDRHQPKSGLSTLTTRRPKSWRPSLQSIHEYGS